MPSQPRFALKQSSLAVVAAVAMLSSQLTYAGAGWADNTDKAGRPFKQPTFYANSPMGVLPGHGPAGTPAPEGTARDTGTPLRKFVDSLPLVDGYVTNANLLAANVSTLGRHIPTAIKEDLTSAAGVALLATTPTAHSISYPDADYYEIAVVEYREQLHSDLPALVPDTTTVPGSALNTGLVTGGTTLRGYVQIWTPNLPASTPKTQLFYLTGKPILDNKGNPVYAAGSGPHYLGPIISSSSHVPVRLKFDNYLPTGHFDPITKTRGGDSFIPTDYTMPGSGLGPLGALDPAVPQPYERYTQNRTNIHLHGGDTPWISDGQPHDWITPAGENTPYPYGAATQNVPDMPDPGPGAQTYFYPNNQSARMMWYHDHSFGSTRLDVYAGIVSAFLIHDAAEAAMQTAGGASIVTANSPVVTTTSAAGVVTSTPTPFTFKGALAGMDEIPLVFEDKTFVPKDVMTEDPRWNTDAWGKYGDLWFPHVYEANQNPDSIDGTNPAGRWDYGPWFWPVFPAPLALPTGYYGDVSSTQEQYADTPLINGIAYPNLKVEPKAYRFRLLNASLQRYVNLGLYVAEPISAAVNNPGNNYSASTTVALSADANGLIPTATLVITPIGAPSIAMTSGGTGYSATPVVTFSGGGATTQATGHAVVAAGVIQGIVVDTAGSGYTSAPTVTISDTTGSGAVAVATPTPGGQIAAITVNPALAGVTYAYTTPPTVTVTDPTGAGSGATFVVSVNTEVPMVPAVQPANGVLAYGINTYDGRPGGIPDPAAMGPNIIHIGSEGGFLAQPNVIHSTPISYEQNRLSVTLLNVLDHGLYVGPAERADFVIDFSQYAGKTLILYNDCPAPNPGFDTRVDYFTGVGDQSSTGGADNTLPGFGPNTRTVMRIQVAATQFSGAAPAAAYDPAGNGGPLATDLPTAFAAVQDKPIVPQSWQNTAYGTNYTDNVAHIYAGTFQQPYYTFNEGGVAQTMSGFQMDSAGTGYTIAPTVVLTGGLGTGGVAATAHAVLDVAGQRVAGIVLDTPGSGYISAPTVVLSGGDGTGASATALTSATQVVEVKNKGIQELFDNNYGRMNATFSAELPFTSVLSQTTVPLGYADPPTESIADQEVQFWKVTHNGVDAHVVHFHLFNVQVINRVGWDGHIKPREASEFGWKETVKMMPLEDIYVAVRPKSPLAPFGVPQSIRPLDPTQPLGVQTGFTQVNPLTGAATTITNSIYNYNWEYAWHCHILGHEENDFMRPMVFDFGTQPPAAVASVSYNPVTQTVSWTDPTPVGVATTYGNKMNEQGFIVQRTETGTFDPLPANPPQSAAMASINPAGYSPYVVGANVTSWHDPVPASATTSYRVLAFNSAGYSPVAPIVVPGTSSTVTTCTLNLLGICLASSTTTTTTAATTLPGAVYSGVPNAPTNVHAKVGAFNYTTGAYPITVTWNATSVPANGFIITRTGGTDFQGNIASDVTFTVPASAAVLSTTGGLPSFTLVDNTGLEISGFKYIVQADNNPLGTTAAASKASLISPGTFVDVLTGYAPPPAINNVTAALTPSGNSVTVSWAAPALTSPDANITASSHVTAYNVVRTSNGVSTTFAVQQILNPLAATNTPPATTYTDMTPPTGVSTYTVYGVNGNLVGTTVGTSSTATVTRAVTAAPGVTGATATATSPTTVSVNWGSAPAGSNPTGYSISRTTGTTTVVLTTPAGLATSFIDTTATQNTSYIYTVTWLNGGSAGIAQTTPAVLTPFAPATPVASVAATFSATANANTVTWVAGGPSTSYVVSRCLATAANANCTNASTVFNTVAQGVTGLTYTDSAIVTGTYVYQVQAMNGPVNLSTGVKAAVVVDTAVAAPNAPATISNTISPGSVTVTWSASTTAATTNYVIQRSVNGGAYAPLVTVPSTTLSFVDTTVAFGNTYAYQVASQITANGVSANSAFTTATTANYLLQATPTLGTVTVSTTAPTYTVTAGSATAVPTATATATITVNFTKAAAVANAPTLTGFDLWAYVNGSATPTKLNTTLIASTATSTTYTAPVGSSYAFYVTAVNAAGDSVAPAAASLTPVYNGLPAPLADATTVPKVTTGSTTTDTVVLDWSPVEAKVNGVAATSYVIQWSNSATNFAATGASGSQSLTLAQATAAGTVAATGASSTVTGSGATAAVKTTFTNVARGSTSPAAASNTIYFRVNTVSGASTSYGAVQVLNQFSVPTLP